MPEHAPTIVNLADAMEAVRQAGVPMHGAPAHGLPLHSNGHLGADVIHVAPHEQFPVHTHPGDHLLLCLQGEGTIAVEGITYVVKPGDIYMVDGMVPHAVGAGGTDHYLVAIGAPHKAVDDPERMAWTDWLGASVDSPLFAQPPRPKMPKGLMHVGDPWDSEPSHGIPTRSTDRVADQHIEPFMLGPNR